MFVGVGVWDLSTEMLYRAQSVFCENWVELLLKTKKVIYKHPVQIYLHMYIKYKENQCLVKLHSHWIRVLIRGHVLIYSAMTDVRVILHGFQAGYLVNDKSQAVLRYVVHQTSCCVKLDRQEQYRWLLFSTVEQGRFSFLFFLAVRVEVAEMGLCWFSRMSNAKPLKREWVKFVLLNQRLSSPVMNG